MTKLACAGCGASLEVVPDSDTFTCRYCGTAQTVERLGELIALKAVKVSLDTVQRGTDRVAAELALPRLRKELDELESDARVATSRALEQVNLASASRRKKVIGSFLAAFFATPFIMLVTGITALGDRFKVVGFLVSCVWLLASVASPVFVYRKTKPQSNRLENVTYQFDERRKTLQAKIKTQLTILQ